MWPEDLKYTESHEWAKVEGDVVTTGFTEFAVTHLSDLVFIDLPEVGDTVTQNESYAEVESVKAVADVNAPVSGEIVEVNEALSDDVETISRDCYDEGWIVKIKMSNPSEMDNLMDAKKYAKHAEAEEEAGH
jgi:glycine cleavage system H protein